MNAKVVALLLALSMVLAVTAAEDEFDLFEMEDLMEKRRGGGGGGRRSKIGKCPYDTRCYCAKLRTGEWSERLMCGQANAANVGI